MMVGKEISSLKTKVR